MTGKLTKILFSVLLIILLFALTACGSFSLEGLFGGGDDDSGTDVVVTFDAAGGVCDTSSATIVEGGTLTLPVPTKEGYEFDGWYNGDTLVSETATYTESTTLIAKWTKLHDVTFVIEGVETVIPSREGELPVWGSTPTKESTEVYDYVFDKWVPELVEVTGEATYTAAFTSSLREHVVTFLNGDGSVLEQIEYHYGDEVTPPTPTKDPDAKYVYTFANWTPSIVAVTKDAVYTPNFTSALRNYTITYDLSGGVNNAGNITQYNYETPLFLLLDPTKDSKEFLGWYTDVDKTQSITQVAGGTTGDITLYAKWKESYYINYVVGDTTLASWQEIKNENATLSIPTSDGTDYNMAGYYVNAWYTDKELTAKFDFTKAMPARDLTLYGSWEYSQVGEGFMQYYTKFSSGGSSYQNAIEINSYEEYVALIEYVLFYDVKNSKYYTLEYYGGNDGENEFTKAYKESTYANKNICTSWVTPLIAPITGGLCVNDTIIAASQPIWMSDGTDIYTEMDYLGAMSYVSTRASDFDDFKISNVTKTISVTSSDQLIYALEHGYRPLPTSGSAAEAVYVAAKEILRQIVDDNMTDEDKIQAMYEWIVQNTVYDYGALEAAKNAETPAVSGRAWFIEGVLFDKRAVCDAFAKTMSLFGRIEGIPIVRVTGDAEGGGSGHAWNKVKLNGTWYCLDATWGNTGISLNEINYEMSNFKYYLFTDTKRTEDGYSTDTYKHIVADTAVNPYQYLTFTYNSQQYDYVIDNQAELEILADYISTFMTTMDTDYVTIQFYVTYTTDISTIYTPFVHKGFDTSYYSLTEAQTAASIIVTIITTY